MEIESWRKFLLIVFAFLLVVNAFFAVIYYAIGVEFLVGMEMKSFGYNFLEAYYFSFQTFTTVGYGQIYPIGPIWWPHWNLCWDGCTLPW